MTTNKKISNNEKISKKYILEHKNNHSFDTISIGLVNYGIPKDEVIKYLEKYGSENFLEINHNKKGLKKFFTGIYKWMFIGLLVSLISMLIVLFTSLYYLIYGSATIFYGFVGIEIALLFGTQFLINKFSPRISLFLYLLYAFVNGITLLGLFLIYSLNSIFEIFFVAITMYLILAVIGYTTKKNLSKLALFLIPGMWGVFIISILNILMQNSIIDFIVSLIAVIIFAGLTVYDNQAYKNIFYQIKTKDDYKRYVVLGAMHMYINFIMIFVNLLKLFGNRD